MTERKKQNFEKRKSIRVFGFFLSDIYKGQNYPVLYESLLKKEANDKIKEIATYDANLLGTDISISPPDIKIENIRRTNYFEKRKDLKKPV